MGKTGVRNQEAGTSKGGPRVRTSPKSEIGNRQSEIISSLVAAGHVLDGFSRHGDHLIVRLTPANLVNDAGGFVALDICDAASLQARCHVFAQQPQNLLILTIKLPSTGEMDLAHAPEVQHD